MSNWQNQSGLNGEPKTKLYIAAALMTVLVIVLAVVLLKVAESNQNDNKQNAAAQGQASGKTATTLADGATTTTDPETKVPRDKTTTTTAYRGKKFLDPNKAESAQGLYLSPAQLADRYPESSSGLSPKDFDASVEIAKAFVLADTTGQGATRFSQYFEVAGGPTPWVRGYQFQFATAMKTTDSNITKTIVYFSGTKESGSSFSQAREVIYFQKTDNGVTPMLRNDVFARGFESPGYDLTIYD